MYKYLIRTSWTILLFTCTSVQATNGYFQIGYGNQSIAMGGTAVALPESGMVIATNPAAITQASQGWQVGLRYFNPDRTASIDCNGVFACNRSVQSKSNRQHFLIPETSYIKHINQTWTLGIAAYSNGGINTDYKPNIIDQMSAAIGGAPIGKGTGRPNTAGSLGIDLAQLVVAPSIAYKFNQQNSLGISLLLAMQRFRGEGLGLAAANSSNASKMTNHGYEITSGLGVRVGWFGQPHRDFSWGLSYSSKIYMNEFDDYSGLFAEQGDFDIPANVVIGFAYKISAKFTLAMDIQRIFYSDVKALNNASATFEESSGTISNNRLLGNDQGIGFGWQSINSYKLGLRYTLNNNWTLRAGYNHGENPVPDNQGLLNVISPGIMTDHITFGASYSLNDNAKIHFSYMHAFYASEQLQFGDRLYPRANVSMDQNAFGVSFSKSY
jgi:long-chain fatty acid transport protein